MQDWFLCKLPAVEVVSIREPAVLFHFLQVTFVTLPAVVTSVNRQLGSVRQQVALPPPRPSARADKTAIFQCYPLLTGRQHV